MRLLKKISHPDGSVEVKLSVGTTEDLWHLYNLIVPGDAVCTKTRRKVTKESDMGSQQSEMRTLLLEVEVKQVDFDPEEIRIQGTNRKVNQYVQLGAHHTLTIHAFPPQDVTVIKHEWDEVANERLKEACQQELRADTAAVLMEFGAAQVLLVTPSFIYAKAKVEVTIAKKHKNDGTARDKSIHRFFKQVLDALLMHVDFEKVKLLLICSPGHVREEFLDYCKENCQRAEQGPLRVLQTNLSKTVLVKVNSNSIEGLREAFRDPVVSQRMESTRCSSDIRTWEAFQSMMNEDADRCVYTPQFVFYAALAGAVSSLMVSDSVFRSADPTERRFFLALFHYAKNCHADVNVFSSNHVTGEQLTQLGNVAAVLYFPVPGLDEMEVVPDFFSSAEAANFMRENAPARVTV